MSDFDLTGELSLKIELHMLRPITEKSTQWQWDSFVSGSCYFVHFALRVLFDVL